MCRVCVSWTYQGEDGENLRGHGSQSEQTRKRATITEHDIQNAYLGVVVAGAPAKANSKYNAGGLPGGSVVELHRFLW